MATVGDKGLRRVVFRKCANDESSRITRYQEVMASYASIVLFMLHPSDLGHVTTHSIYFSFGSWHLLSFAADICSQFIKQEDT